MSRLLFAAARGARILYGSGRLLTDLVSLEEDAVQFIHQDDEHLQYGPISSILREFSDGDVEENEYIRSAMILIEKIEPDWILRYKDLQHRSFFLLFLAEYLADEGI